MSVRHKLFKNKRRVIKNCLLISLLLCAAMAGLLLAQNETGAAQDAAEEDPVAVDANEQKLADDCSVTWEFYYETCAHTVEATSKIPTEMAGLTLKALQSKYPNLQVLDFAPHHIALQKSIKQYCPDHFILKNDKGELVIFKTDLGKDTVSVVQRMGIAMSSVPADLQDELSYGCVMSSMDEVQQYIAERIEGQPYTEPTEGTAAIASFRSLDKNRN